VGNYSLAIRDGAGQHTVLATLLLSLA